MKIIMEDNIMEDKKEMNINEVAEYIKRKAAVDELESETIDFPSLNADIDFSKKKIIREPVFFIPTKSPEAPNVLQSNGEPFSEVAIPMAAYNMKFMGTENYFFSLEKSIIDQCAAMILNNVSIILNNGIIAELDPFVINCEEFVHLINYELFKFTDPYSLIHYNVISRQLRAAIFNEDTTKISTLLADAINKNKNNLAYKFSLNTHNFIRKVLIDRVIDIDRYFDTYYRYTDHDTNVVPDKFSVSMQMLLDTAIVDVTRITDIAELAIVSAFYQLSDAIVAANKIGIKFRNPKYEDDGEIF